MKNNNVAFFERMKSLLGEEFESFKQSLIQPMQKAIYVNENKIEVESFKKLADFDLQTISYERAGFYVNQEKLGKHPLHIAGAFYCQEPSAMFTVNATSFVGDEKVLDMCAAPGGKTIQLANKIKNGVVVSNEINPARASMLYSNVERMGLNNVIVCNNSPNQIALAYANSFDVCLVDAPCSAEGMFRKEERYLQNWNENLPQMCAKRQKEILLCADKTLKQGGKLIYSTCTYSLEENEQVVNWFIEECGYKLLNIKADLPRGIGLKQCVRLYPHKVKGEGQFVAVLQKQSQNNLQQTPNLKLKPAMQAQKFVNETLTNSFLCHNYNNLAYYVADETLIKPKINYLSLGVKIGEENKQNFVPHHNLFTAFGKDFKNKINFNFNEKGVAKYIHGDVLDIPLPAGFGAFLVNFCPIGGFKSSNGQLKNHFPKGLRI